MTLEEAIKHAEEVAEEHTKYNRYGGFEGCDECAEEHRQLAEWLKDYKRLLEQQPCEDTISRQAAIDATWSEPSYTDPLNVLTEVRDRLKALPSAQPEPLSDAYMKAVWTWLLDYQINVAKLKGRYTPYEVLSWVANDWRKEHE